MRWAGLSIAILLLAQTGAAINQAEILYLYDKMPEPVRFAALELEEVLRSKGLVVSLRDMHTPSAADSVFRVTVGDLTQSPTLRRHPLAANPLVQSASFGSFEIRLRKSGESAEVLVAGADASGAMYGLLEVAEHVDNAGTIESPYRAIRDGLHEPFLRVRGAQILIHRQALEDPWSWFYSEDFWRGFVDLLARSRFNLLDLHGVYDIVTTRSYSFLPYFTHVSSFPDAGVGGLQAEQNAAMLARIVELAENRGLHVFLMPYGASWAIPGHPAPSKEETEESLGAYTRQAWKQLLAACPSLYGLGMRVGESGRGILFYKRYVIPAIGEAEGDHPLILRSWLLSPKDIHSLAEDHKGVVAVEVKFNGDFLGLPYQVTGGRTTGWKEYTFGDFLSYPRRYDVIYELRAGGDHRVFPWIDPEAIRRIVHTCRLGGAFGMTLQPIGAYGPVPDSYTNTVHENLSYWTWTYERDWYWWLIWGRLAYQPDLPDRTFEYYFRRHFPFLSTPHIRSVLDTIVNMSQVVPAIYATACLGPDRRNMAPELETVGSVADLYERIAPLDTATFQSISELVTHRTEGTASGKKSPLELLEQAVSAAEQAVQALGQVLELYPTASVGTADVSVPPLERKRWQEIRAWELDAYALNSLGRYHLAKALSAYNLGLYRLNGSYPHLLAAEEGIRSASEEWGALSMITDRRYRPFPEVLRMRTTQFHWLNQLPNLEEDRRLIAQEIANWKEFAKTRRWRPSFGHLPPPNPRPGQSLVLQLSFPPAVPVKGLKVRYRNSVGKGETLDVREGSQPYTYVVNIAGENVGETEGTFEYFFSANIAGHPVDSTTLMGGRPYRVFVTNDREPPRITRLQEQMSEKKDSVVVSFDVSDTSGVAKVRLWWKPLPSAQTWQALVLQGKGSIYTGAIPCTPTGILYCLEALDAVGNGALAPDPEVQTPYWVIEPWE